MISVILRVCDYRRYSSGMSEPVSSAGGHVGSEETDFFCAICQIMD